MQQFIRTFLKGDGVRTSGKIKLSQKAYDSICQLIVTLQLKPGEQIEEGYLEKKLSIGRTPIREALQRLAMEKLLDLIPGRGFFVRSISIDDVKSLFEAMTALEQIIVRLAAFRIQESQINELQKISNEHKEAIKKKDFLKVSRLNKNFHYCFCVATGNTFLITAMDGLSRQSERIAYLTYTKEAHPSGGDDFNSLAINDHEMLIESFRQGDAEKAVEIITAHCRLFFVRVCHYMEPKISTGISQLPELFFDITIENQIVNDLKTRI